MRFWRFTLSSVLFLLAVSYLTAQRGAITRPNTLEQMTAESQLIVHGYVLGSHVEPHPDYPNLSTVVVNMKVVDVLKGSTAQQFTFRQFIWDIRDRMDSGGYRKGQELVLLLGPTSKIGLRSPAGLDQGRFRVERFANGKTKAVNGTGNISLFTDRAISTGAPAPTNKKIQISSQLRANPGSMSLDDLKQIIRAYVGGR